MAKREMSQADLSRKTGLTTGGISNLINQVRNPSPEACTAIAAALNIQQETVFRAAGLLSPLPEKDKLTGEAEFLLSQMPKAKREQAVAFIRFLANQKGDHDVTSSMEEDLNT